jgi:hypothetical protein
MVPSSSNERARSRRVEFEITQIVVCRIDA